MRSLIQIKLVFLFLIFSFGLTFAQVEIDPLLLDALQNSSEPVQVVVTFNGEGAPTASQMQILSDVGITAGFSFQSLPIAGVVANASQVNALSENPEIRSLYLNSELEYHNNNSRGLTGVDRLRTDQNIISQNGGMPVSGDGIGVLVNDSGIDGTHPDLEFGEHVVQNVQGATNPHAYETILPIVYLEDQPNTDLTSGHGTHCAGTVGGTGVQSAGKYQGVAPGANIVGYGSGAVLLILDAIGGFDYALTHQYQYGIRVISNSWGSSGDFSPNNPVNVASYHAYQHNITVVFSASNSGPVEDTHNPYAQAPWVISVAASDTLGLLADFSSRGVKDQSDTFELDGVMWTWENRPTITAPGVMVVSCRAPGTPVGHLYDDSGIEPEYVAHYTTLSGTSMSCPHVAGIAALLLEVDPTLSPLDIKEIIQKTATNIPNREPWEVGAGMVNAYAAVDYVLRGADYGSTVNKDRDFNAELNVDINRIPWNIEYWTVPELSPTNNEWQFTVPEGITAMEVRCDVHGITGEEGNTINLVLVDPDGNETSSGIYVAFTLYHDRAVALVNPVPGEWTVRLDGLRGAEDNPTGGTALPEDVNGLVKLVKVLGYSGLDDVDGHPLESSIKLSIANRLSDGLPGGIYNPDDNLTRIQLADYLVMGQAVRQYLPTNGSFNFTDIDPEYNLIVESVTNTGAVLRDRFHEFNGVIEPTGTGTFSPNGTVNRTELCYSLVQSLGYQEYALALNGSNVTVTYNGEEIPIDDAVDIPAGYEGYVQLALDLNLINAFYSLEQGPGELFPTIHANFHPLQNVTRGEFAVIVTRTHNQWINPELGKGGTNDNSQTVLTYELDQNYPNPFNPSTTINYSLPENGMVTLEVFNILGQKVKTLVNNVQTAGTHQVNFDASELASGTYIYKINSGSFQKTMKMMLLK